MMYVEIFCRRDGRYEEVLRLWEDGRLEGQPMWMKSVATCRRPDPITGEVAMRGPALVRRITDCFNSGYVFARIGVTEVKRLPEHPLGRRRR